MNARQTAEMAEIIGIDRAEQELSKRALDDLVDLVMRGEEYPKGVHRGQQINRLDILGECDQFELAQAVEWAIKDQVYTAALTERITAIVRAYLYESVWHTTMIEQLKFEERE